MNKTFKDLIQELSQFKLPIALTVFLFITIFFSIFVRSQDLGYSNFQGDEINPMDFMYEMSERNISLFSYLMEQKRGPVQYLINYANVGLFGYHNEWQIRFPFLVFGVLAIFVFYKLLSLILSKRVALLATTLLSMNGLFIAFARITQYQAVMCFLVPLGIILFVNAMKDYSLKKFFFAGLVMFLALLAHYDTFSVLPFFIVAFIGDLYRNLNGFSFNKNKTTYLKFIKRCSVFFFTMLVPAMVYYGIFYMSKTDTDPTEGYLLGRLFGGGLMPRTEITTKLVSMYVPKVHLLFLFISELLGLLAVGLNFDDINIKKKKIDKKYVAIGYRLLVLAFGFGNFLSFTTFKPRTATLLVIASSLLLVFVLFISKKINVYYGSLVAWALGSYCFYLFIMRDPRTHVYVAILPALILAGVGLSYLFNLIRNKYGQYLLSLILIVSFIWASIVNWVIFVDKNPEYPWFDKYVFGWNVYHIEKVRQEKIDGVFGFNQYRAWEYIRELYDNGCLVGTFNSNEKDSITYFYMRMHQDPPGFNDLALGRSINMVVIDGPHSWYYRYIKDQSYSGYNKLFEMKSGDKTVMRIFGEAETYPDGKFLCKDVPEFKGR